jgi:hypothetical protein
MGPIEGFPDLHTNNVQGTGFAPDGWSVKAAIVAVKAQRYRYFPEESPFLKPL